MTFKEKVSFVWHLPWERKTWLLYCFIGSVLSVFIIYCLPSKHLSRFLGHQLGNRQLCSLATPKQIMHARQIASLMKTVADSVPWPCKCLARAICVNWIYQRHKIPAITYLGVKLTKDEPSGMKAHAWVCVGPKIVIGEQLEQYPIVGSFSSIDVSSLTQFTQSNRD